MNKTYPTQLKQLGPRQVQAVISTEAVDREHDRIMLSGLDLTNYKRNPVVLFAHDYKQPPVGVCKEIGLVSGQLRAVCEFTEPGVNPTADLICALVKGGQLSATSIGFRSTASLMNEFGGYDYVQAELLEWSFVPVPANAECLVIARSAGLDERRLKEFFGGTRDLVSDDDRELFRLDDEDVSLTPAAVRSAIAAAVPELVREAVAARMARGDEHVLHLTDEIDVDERDVAEALRTALPLMVSAHVGRAIRMMRGRLED
jgi:HK97 family phage prohead protease